MESMICLVKPDKSISVCSGMLITTWVLYLIFIGSFVMTCVLYRKLAPKMSDDYVRMTQRTEISHSEASDHENVQNMGIPNYML